MEPNLLRTDPILDNRPASDNKNTPQHLVYILIFILGMFSIGLGCYVRFLEHEKWGPEILIAMGVAVAAPGVLSFLYRKFMLEEIKIELQQPANEFRDTATVIIQKATDSIIDKYSSEISLITNAKMAGLVNVYISRSEAIHAFMPYIETEKNEILLIGSSFRGLLKEFDFEYQEVRKLLMRKQSEKVSLRFLLTHPIIADLRAKQENRPTEEIGAEILDSINVLLSPEWNIPRDNIKLYLGTPTCFGIRASEAMLLNTYPYMKEAFASPCLIVKKPGYFYEHFHTSHFKAWTTSIAKPLPSDLNLIRGKLKQYANCIEGLLQ